MIKTKTQTTINDNLQLVVNQVKGQYPIFSLNQSIDFLLAKGTKAFLDEMDLTMEDLAEIQKSKDEIANGDFVTGDNFEDFIKNLNS